MRPGDQFTRDELDRLARRPLQQVQTALEESPTAARATYDALERHFRGSLRSFARWEEGTLDALRQEPDALPFLARASTTGAWSIAGRNQISPTDLATTDARHGTRLEDEAAHRGEAAALSLYRELEGSFVRVRDAHRDAVSELWSVLHQVAGREGLEACLRRLAESTLLRWMERDLELPDQDRLREWAAVLTANFARIHISEHEDRFVIVQDPCGTCTRQILDAGHATDACTSSGSSPGLPTIEPFAAEHIGTEPVPLYRSHVGLMHWLMPIERIGRPWPVIRCPAGAGTGACRIELGKATPPGR